MVFLPSPGVVHFRFFWSSVSGLMLARQFLLHLLPPCFVSTGNPHTHFGAQLCCLLLDVAKAARPAVLIIKHVLLLLSKGMPLLSPPVETQRCSLSHNATGNLLKQPTEHSCFSPDPGPVWLVPHEGGKHAERGDTKGHFPGAWNCLEG